MMRISIEDNRWVYVSIEEDRDLIDKTLSNVQGKLLYDKEHNWIGFRVYDQDDEGKHFTLPTLNVSSLPDQISYRQMIDSFEVLFGNVQIDHLVDFEFNLDVSKDNVAVGVEILFYRGTVGGRNIVAPFVIGKDK